MHTLIKQIPKRPVCAPFENLHREYGGLIYENSDGSYSFTGPIAGDNESMQPLNAPAPNGANVTAYYHTHGAYDPKSGIVIGFL
jgi:hypothetical protein